jgi:heterodisulfide reductase subunit A
MVDQERCSGCRVCGDLCPFSAIGFGELRGVADIDAKLCQGCGVCVAACPARAIAGSGFSHEQIMAQIDGLLIDRAEVPASAAGEPVGVGA